jgi:hypothetical protein
LTGSGISSIDALLSFDADSFGLTNPEELVVYRRNLYGETRPFASLPTTFAADRKNSQIASKSYCKRGPQLTA